MAGNKNTWYIALHKKFHGKYKFFLWDLPPHKSTMVKYIEKKLGVHIYINSYMTNFSTMKKKIDLELCRKNQLRIY